MKLYLSQLHREWAAQENRGDSGRNGTSSALPAILRRIVLFANALAAYTHQSATAPSQHPIIAQGVKLHSHVAGKSADPLVSSDMPTAPLPVSLSATLFHPLPSAS